MNQLAGISCEECIKLAISYYTFNIYLRVDQKLSIRAHVKTCSTCHNYIKRLHNARQGSN